MRWPWLVLFALLACCHAHAESPPPDRAFYYWRTTFALSAAERTALTDLHVTRLYVRVFDIDWNATEKTASMVGKLTGEKAPEGIEIVPVVFIKNEVFKQPSGGAGVAKALWDEVSRRAAILGKPPRELQLDCDWTDKTKDRFFGFIRDVRAAAPGINLSATIRLHQVKYRETTGVPPVDRGMLMFYNMGKFSADTDDRAIFDDKAASAYVERIGEYPLPLDVALPIWSWTVHVRDGRVIDLLQSTDPDELPEQDFLIPGGLDRFVATRNAFLHGALLREGDVLKIERMAPRDTLAAADMLSGRLATGARTVALFDLSERNLQRHGKDQLDHVFRAIR